MKSLLAGKRFYICTAILILALILADACILFPRGSAGAATAPEGGPDKYEIRSNLMMGAMGRVGSCSPGGAAGTWAEGLRLRSAALQYAVMSEELKRKYAADLEETFPNWVTGVSSPWIASYQITGNSIDGDNWCYHIRFSTETSSGPAGDYDAVLIISFEDPFWRVTEIVTERELDAYTGLRR